MQVLQGKSIQKDRADKTLFTIRDLKLSTGQKVGLIGDNGVGKSTLLQMMVGEDLDYEGQLALFCDVAYVPQLKEDEALSGGEIVLSAVKRALAQRASFLILDEPTANLDWENQQWLIYQLRRYRGCLLVVSHDRAFLDRLVDEIWVLDEGRLVTYQGNYSQVESQREQERQQSFQDYTIYKEKVRQLESILEKKKAAAKKLTKKKKTVSRSDWKVNSKLGAYDGKSKAMAKSAKAIEKRVERLDVVARPKKEAWVKLELKGKLQTKAHRLLRLEAGKVFISEQYLFSHPELSVTFGEKIGLMGRNGVGKTTLVEQIIQRKRIGYYSNQLEIAYFSQKLQQLDCEKTVVENASNTSLQDRVTVLNLLAMLGLPYQKSQQLVKKLSGGERVRLGLAKVLLSDANLLILDEPTNFLDLTSIKALEQFLERYQGAVLLISHDEALVTRLSQTVWKVENHRMDIRSLIPQISK